MVVADLDRPMSDPAWVCNAGESAMKGITTRDEVKR